MNNIEYIYERDSVYVVFMGGIGQHFDKNSAEGEEVREFIKNNPHSVKEEPILSAPTPEQLKEREIAEKLAYLQSTDWYVIRFADSGVPVPDDIKAARAQARARIDELKGGAL